MRDHLFISYAWEDAVFAKWLALRLTSERYRVWIDQYKLLGGESWPQDIDHAIKTRAFRMLALLSKNSIAKPNPVKERTLALNIARQPGRKDFLIPINVDGLRPLDLDWLSSDITFVPFDRSWAEGLAQLLKLLEREACPRFDGDGRAASCIAASGLLAVSSCPEDITSNVQRFTQIPEDIHSYLVRPALQDTAATDAARDWPFYTVSPQRVLAFFPPAQGISSWLRVERVRTTPWRTKPLAEGIDNLNVVSALLRAAVETHCRLRGLVWSQDAGAYFFGGPLGANLRVVLPSGDKTTVQHSGERTFFRIGQPKMPYRYRLAARPAISRMLFDEFNLTWRLRLHLTDSADNPLPSQQRLSRRKHATRSWFNRQWLVRQLAVMQFLADTEGQIRVGPPGSSQIILDCAPASFISPKSIDERKLEQVEELGDDVPAEDDGSSEEVDDEDAK